MDMFDERKLLDYATYEDYLDSFITNDDLRYLRNKCYGRMIAELGYRSTGETLTREQFKIRKNAVHEALYPSRKPHILASNSCDSSDLFLKELAFRERSNKLGLLSTIIFIMHHRKNGFEISGYIDFEESLRKSRMQEDGSRDWYAIFGERKRLWPNPTDLGYYNWRSGYSVVNNTDNYEVIADPLQGLIFICRHDRKHICIDPFIESPGSNTTRTLVYTNKYDHVVLYDHVVRMKI